MIKKLNFIFALILVFNILLTTTTVYAEVPINQDSLDNLVDSYEASIRNFRATVVKKTLTNTEFDILREYQKYEEIPVYFYCNNEEYLTEYNNFSGLRLVVDLLSKQLDLNLKFEIVFVDDTLTLEEQLKTRTSDAVAFDLVASNNLTMFNNAHPEIEVSLPVLSENLFVVARANMINNVITGEDTLAYDPSVYDIQSKRDYKTKFLGVPNANSEIVNGLTDYYFTPIYNLPTVTKNSTLLYKSTFSSLTLPNSFTTVYGLSANFKNKDIINIINKFITPNFISSVQTHRSNYETFIKEYSFYNSLTPIELQYIENNETLTVYYNENSNLLQVKDGKVEGFIPDVVNRVSELSGLEPEYVDSTSINSSSEESLDVDSLNILSLYSVPVAKQLTTTFNSHETETLYAFSNTYVTHSLEILRYYTTDQLTSINQLQFTKIGTLNSFVLNANWFMSKHNLNTSNFVTFSTKEELVEALQSGDIDYAIMPPGNVAYFTSHTNYGISSAYVNESLGMDNINEWTLILHDNKDITALTSIFSKAASTLDYDDLINKWFPPKTEYVVYNQYYNKKVRLFYTVIFLSVITFSIVSQINKNRKQNVARVSDASSIDKLTGLKNYNAFNNDKENIKNGYLIIGYILRCKRVNQIYGMSKTDQIIKAYSKLLAEECGQDHIYRTSGDRFHILLPDPRNEIELQKYIKQLYATLNGGVDVGGKCIKLKWSLAAAPFSLFNNNIEEFIDVTQELAIDTKTNDKTNFAVLDAKEYDNIASRTVIYDVLRNISPDNMFPFYQPFVDAKTYQVKGCEVLARLKLGDEIIPAYRFIQLADKIGSLGTIDKLILEKTLAFRTELLFKGIIDNNFYFSINFSAQFLRVLTSEYLYDLSRRYGVKSFDFLQIEILEEELTSSEIERIKRIIREFNLKTAIDDFSTGHSTISRLNNFNFDVVKMDRSLLPINFTLLDREIYKSLIQMVEGFSESIVVEGVETQEHVDFLKTTTVDTLQGFFFAKPMPKSDFVNYILNTNMY